MVKQKAWNMHEAAILLETVILLHEGKVDRKTAIEEVSGKLRSMAIKSGLEIDEIYRNIAGITFQMYSMESAYVGYTMRKPATKLFLEAVKIMREQPQEYEKILQEAKELIGENKSMEEKYLSWLSTKVSRAQMSELYMVYPEIEDFCLSRKILKNKLFETSDIQVLANVRKTVDSNGIFRFKYKRQAKKMSVAIRYYVEFIKEESQKPVTTEILEATNEFEKETETIVDEYTPSVMQDISPEERKQEFMDWMINNGMAVATVRPYVSSVGLVGKIALDHGIIAKDVFSIADAEVLKQALNSLMNDEEFVEKNESRHNQFRAAWVKYINFSGDSNFASKSVRAEGRTIQKNADSSLYMRLKSMASVYDDVHGFEIEWIQARLGLEIDLDELRIVLDETKWITEVAPDVYSFAKNAKPFEQTIEFDKDAFVRVLMMRYQNGMRFDSIDFENFRETYADIIGETVELTDRELELCLRKCGVLYEGRIFPAEGIINSSAREKLISYIADSFGGGKQVLYYKAIYSDLADVFAYCFNLTDAMMLKPYLEYVSEDGEYFFAEDYMSKEANITINHSAEIEEFLLAAGKPLSYEEIYAGLSHISRDVVNSEIRTNSNIILNEKEHYYHYGIFEFSSEDADKISGFISDDIEEEGYCIWSRVFVRIQQTMPLFVENNIYLSSIGIRNAIAKKLAGRFNFDSEVICVRGQSLNMAAVYKLYGQHHAPFSDEDIYEFAKEVSGKVIYFDSLSEATVRTSKNLFVPIDDISFDVEAVDNALATYLSTGYMLIRDIDSFLVFPNVGYEWNAYLLESYLMYFSEKYSLVNNGRSLNNVAGALVRKGTGFDDFLNVSADVLANSDVPLSKAKALDYLADQNLLTRRSYAKIDEAISKARQIRNKKG